MRTMLPLLVGLAACCVPSTVWGLGLEHFGNEPLAEANYTGWPGIMPVVNHSSRVYHIWVNGNEHFYYAEIGTDRTSEELLAILQVISVRAPVAETLIDTLETLYGLPPLEEPVGICSTGLTEAESRRLARQARQRRTRARERLQQWSEQQSDQAPEDRLRAVVEQWKAFLNRPDSGLNRWGALLAAGIDRLLRLGPGVVPLLRDAQAEETGSLERGRLELPIAYLSREADAEIVNALLQGDEQQKLLACDIVAVADDDRFITPLERVQQAEIGTVYQRIHETLEQLRHGVMGCDF